MLVRIANADQTAAAQPIVEWMSGWTGAHDPRGLALFNVDVHAEGGTRRLDAVVWTPACCVVMEIEQLTDKLGGELVIPLNGPWTVDGEPVNLSGPDARTPLDQSRDRTYALQNWLADNRLGQHSVRGLVVLTPAAGSSLQLIAQWHDPSFAVVLGDRESRLRDYFASLDAKPTESWTANDLADAFRALGCAELLPPAKDLLAQGFGGAVDPARWGGGVAPGQFEVYDPFLPDPQPEGRFPYSPWTLYPKEPGRSDPGRTALRLTLAVGMVVAAGWVVWLLVTLTLMSF